MSFQNTKITHEFSVCFCTIYEQINTAHSTTRQTQIEFYCWSAHFTGPSSELLCRKTDAEHEWISTDARFCEWSFASLTHTNFLNFSSLFLTPIASRRREIICYKIKRKMLSSHTQPTHQVHWRVLSRRPRSTVDSKERRKSKILWLVTKREVEVLIPARARCRVSCWDLSISSRKKNRFRLIHNWCVVVNTMLGEELWAR